jgi:hypothetical protein
MSSHCVNKKRTRRSHLCSNPGNRATCLQHQSEHHQHGWSLHEIYPRHMVECKTPKACDLYYENGVVVMN